MSTLGRTLICTVVALALAGCTRKTPPEPILVGHVASSGGSEEALFESAKRGIQLAVLEANEAEGLIAGRRVMVLHPSVRGEADSLPHVAARLISVNKVTALLGGTDAGQAQVIGQAAQPFGVPVVTLTALPARQLSQNVFAAQLAPADQGQVLARFAAEELKADRVAVIAGAGEGSADLAAAFARQFTKDVPAGRADRWSYPEMGAADLADQVREARPKAIVMAGSAGSFAELRGALHTAGLDVPLLFGGPACERMALGAGPKAGKGVYLATSTGAAEDSRSRQFPERYEKVFGGAPDARARLAYDAARVLFEAMRRANSAHKDRVREELATVFVVRLEESRPKDAKAFKLEGR